MQEIKSDRFDAAIIEDIVAEGYFKSNDDLQGFVIPDAKAEEAILLRSSVLKPYSGESSFPFSS